jgi:acyl-CoA reductase-like NAD-dependent aldehyde dehydrogenase
VKEPIGVVGCITPWNYPLNQICTKIAPAMIVGCTVVLKPSSVTPINAILLAECIDEAGIPPGVFNLVNGRGGAVGEFLATHPEVDMVHVTGSTRVGQRLTVLSADTLKSVRTELGGKSAALMLEDGDFKKVLPQFVSQAMQNSGQSCNALSRLLLPRSRYEEGIKVAQGVAEAMAPSRPDEPKAVNGPLVSQSQWNSVQGYINKGIEEGARLVTGGPGKPPGLEDGYFAKNTVFADVNNKMTIAQEEIFGPVLSIIPYDTEQEAIDIVNDTIYGLNNAVGSANSEHAVAVARQLRSGCVMINSTKMLPDGPFGGYKQSGNAREWGLLGIEEFLLVKHLAGNPRPKSKL